MGESQGFSFKQGLHLTHADGNEMFQHAQKTFLDQTPFHRQGSTSS